MEKELKRTVESNTVESQPDFDDVPEGTQLPMPGIARALAGTEVARLRRRVEVLEREAANTRTAANGLPDAYLSERSRELIGMAEAAKAEISELQGMDEHSARMWAWRRGYSGDNARTVDGF